MTESTTVESDHLSQLKTLYTVSRGLFEAKDSDTVLVNFLRTIQETLNIPAGLVLLHDMRSDRIVSRKACGLDERELAAATTAGTDFFNTHPLKDENGASFLADPQHFPQPISALIPFRIDKAIAGLLALGAKPGFGRRYLNQDVDLLLTLTNHLGVALRNSRFLQQVDLLNRDLQKKNLDLENAFRELDRRVYHLKTLNDISRDIFSTVEFESILNHFLLMIMGNFGVMQGFAMIVSADVDDMRYFKSMGYEAADSGSLQKGAREILNGCMNSGESTGWSIMDSPAALAPHEICALPFRVTDECCGFIGLGPKLIGDPFTEDDRELMMTLVNSLVVSLTNARSFENIRRLNLDLQEKNKQLKATLEELKAALRKVELLESIKTNLSKFVPTAVTKLVENASQSEIHEAQEQDISVLFLDIEGYTKITDEIGATNVNTLIEKYFSVFMDAIYANDGDVVETAGDGLMVLFLNANKKENALQAVRAARTILDKACSINDDCTLDSRPCLVNVGVSSGKAFVGAAKFESIIGSRWTYTTHGTIVNVAARLCGQAKGGQVLVSDETVARVAESFRFRPLGKFALKNLSEAVNVFMLDG
jgi:class 3 adenylate cyclase/transcriptional regulator with GAF, ATPase, and Fis domain